SLLRDGARMTIEALTELDMVVDGEPRRARRGERLEPGANGRLELLLPELLRLRFDAGEGAEPLRREVETLERELRARLAAHGAGSLDELRAKARSAQDRRARDRAVAALVDELVPPEERRGSGLLDALDG